MLETKSLGLTVFELLFSLLGLSVLSLFTIFARRGLIYASRSNTRVRQAAGKITPAPEIRKEKVYGLIGVAVSLLGFYLPIIFLFCLICHQDSVLINPEMDDWETGPGWLYVRLCERAIILCQLLAVGFGVASRRTALGPIVFVIAAAIIYGSVVRHWIADWYTVVTHF